MSTWGGFKRRGKTLFFGLAAFGALAIGMAVFGPLADVLPLQWIMIGSGAALISMAAVIRCDRSFSD